MFSFPKKCHKSQADRVLELLIKHWTVTSLQLSQLKPVILNFHQQIHLLKQKHNIETVIEIVKGIKHTSYIYHGRLAIPCIFIREKKFTESEVKAIEEIAYEEWFQACLVQYDLLPKKRGRPLGSKNK